jgi:hypothetical protein
MGSLRYARRLWIPSGVCLALGLATAFVACESSPPNAGDADAELKVEDLPAPVVPLDTLSGARALADLRELAGKRSEGGAALRKYVTEQLAATDLRTETVQTSDPAKPDVPARSQVVANESGTSSDLFLLVARLDAKGDENALSGAALLIELARVLSTRSLPYATRFVWLDGADDAAASYAADLNARGELSRVRLLVDFERVCAADLRIARDLESHRVHREEFFDAAVRTGHASVFPRDASFETVEGAQLAFRTAGIRSVVALSSASPATPDAAAPSGCAPASLDAVGDVTLDALEAIGRRLAKIDRFSRAPIASVERAAATPPAATPATPATSAPPPPEAGPAEAPKP